MHPLTAPMPDAEVPRSDVVAARIARKVGPLFGVVWEPGLFGRTWVCDFGTITLAEIARGAPYPPRDVQAAMDAMDDKAAGEERARDQPPSPDWPAQGTAVHGTGPKIMWRTAGRAVWTPRRTPTPMAIANATLNRYGPDTKAAVVLTGANRLLQDLTATVASVCGHMAGSGASLEVRLAVWSGLVLEVFRGQPALMAAAIQARAIQRALTTPWGQHLWLPGLGESARCEFGMPGSEQATIGRPGGDPQSPTGLDLIDSTLPLVGLPLPVDDGPLLSRQDLLDDVAARWCRRLLQIGHPGRGVTWVAETAPGHRSVQSYVRVGSVIAPFVAEVFSALGIGERPGRRIDPGQVAGLLSGVSFGSLTVHARRAHVLAAHVLANYLRFHDNLLLTQPGMRAASRALTATAAADAAEWLGASDPATLLIASYSAYCEAWDTSRDGTADSARRNTTAGALTRHLDKVTQAWRAGQLDPGTASYLLEIGATALDRLHEGTPAGRAELWRHVMLARGIDPERDLDDPLTLPAAQCYHLQNYASYLASSAAGPDDLRRALAAQRACAGVRDRVTYGELAEYDAKFTSARTSRQAAAAIAGRLAEATGPAGSSYHDLLAEGVAHALAALENPTAREMLAAEGADSDLVRLALAVLPVILAARELDRSGRRAGDPPLAGETLLRKAAELLTAATSAASRLGRALADSDRAALAALACRAAVLANPGSGQGHPDSLREGAGRR